MTAQALPLEAEKTTAFQAYPEAHASLSECLGYRVDSLETGRLGVLQGVRESGIGEAGRDLVVSMGGHLGRVWLIPADEVDVVVHPSRQIVVRSARHLYRSMIIRAAA